VVKLNSFEIVKLNVSTLEAIQRYCGSIKITQKGSRNWCNCIFHSEKTPSMCIYPNGSFYCHSCNVGGQDSIKLVEKLFGLKPLEALKKLAEDFNIPLQLGKKLDRTKIQLQVKKKEKLEIVSEKVSCLLETFYHNLSKLFKMFRHLVEVADVEGIQKESSFYRWLLFNRDMFERYGVIFGESNVEKQINLLLNAPTEIEIEGRMFFEWLETMQSNKF
jgi:hypothetical protein